MIPEVSQKDPPWPCSNVHSDRLHKDLVDPSEDPKADHVSHKHLRCSQRPADVDSFTNHRYGRYGIVNGKIFRKIYQYSLDHWEILGGYNSDFCFFHDVSQFFLWDWWLSSQIGPVPSWLRVHRCSRKLGTPFPQDFPIQRPYKCRS